MFWPLRGCVGCEALIKWSVLAPKTRWLVYITNSGINKVSFSPVLVSFAPFHHLLAGTTFQETLRCSRTNTELHFFLPDEKWSRLALFYAQIFLNQMGSNNLRVSQLSGVLRAAVIKPFVSILARSGWGRKRDQCLSHIMSSCHFSSFYSKSKIRAGFRGIAQYRKPC